jgi:hypothetical protein
LLLPREGSIFQNVAVPAKLVGAAYQRRYTTDERGRCGVPLPIRRGFAAKTPGKDDHAMADPRVEMLRGLAAQIEQSPPSEKRDALLTAVRERIVTVDAGAWKFDSWGGTPDDDEDPRGQLRAELLDELR